MSNRTVQPMKFDLVDWQQDVKAICDHRTLYAMFDQLCRLKEKKVISSIEFDECKELVFERFNALNSVQNALTV